MKAGHGEIMMLVVGRVSLEALAEAIVPPFLPLSREHSR